MEPFPTLSSYWRYIQEEHFPYRDPTPLKLPRDKHSLELYSVAEVDLRRARFTNAFIAQSGIDDLRPNLRHPDYVEEVLNALHEELDNVV